MFEPSGKKVEARLGNILDIAQAAGVEIDAPCGGRETCGKCRVIVRSGADSISAIRDSERRFLSAAEIETGYRLGCCASIISANEFVLEVPPESQLGIQRLLVGGLEPSISLGPIVRKFVFSVPKAEIKDLRADTERFFDSVNQRLGIGINSMAYEALKALPRALR